MAAQQIHADTALQQFADGLRGYLHVAEDEHRIEFMVRGIQQDSAVLFDDKPVAHLAQYRSLLN